MRALSAITIVLLCVVSVVVLFGQEQPPAEKKTLQISWDKDQTTYIGLPVIGKKVRHVHFINGSSSNLYYSAVEIEITSEPSSVAVKASGLVGQLASHTCESIRQMQHETLGLYTLGIDDQTGASVSELESKGVQPFEIKLVNVAAAPNFCPKVPPGCCGCEGAGHCTSCCPRSGHCMDCSSCGLCCN